jgi:hypothetical protein
MPANLTIAVNHCGAFFKIHAIVNTIVLFEIHIKIYRSNFLNKYIPVHTGENEKIRLLPSYILLKH